MPPLAVLPPAVVDKVDSGSLTVLIDTQNFDAGVVGMIVEDNDDSGSILNFDAGVVVMIVEDNDNSGSSLDAITVLPPMVVLFNTQNIDPRVVGIVVQDNDNPCVLIQHKLDVIISIFRRSLRI
eukprot:scaffold49924_cov59-Attheya_sp.AAC.2